MGSRDLRLDHRSNWRGQAPGPQPTTTPCLPGPGLGDVAGRQKPSSAQGVQKVELGKARLVLWQVSLCLPLRSSRLQYSNAWSREGNRSGGVRVTAQVPERVYEGTWHLHV